MRWTPEMDGLLRKMWDARKTGAVMAVDMSRATGITFTKNAVIGRAHRLGLDPRPTPIGGSYTRGMKLKTVLTPPGRAVQTFDRHSLNFKRAASPTVLAKRAPIDMSKVILSKRQCSWPIGDPHEADFHFCTDKAIEGKPYCPEHQSIGTVSVKLKAASA